MMQKDDQISEVLKYPIWNIFQKVWITDIWNITSDINMSYTVTDIPKEIQRKYAHI